MKGEEQDDVFVFESIHGWVVEAQSREEARKKVKRTVFRGSDEAEELETEIRFHHREDGSGGGS